MSQTESATGSKLKIFLDLAGFLQDENVWYNGAGCRKAKARTRNGAGNYSIREKVMIEKKVIIVEGRTDKERLRKILAEPVEIVCTNGTLSEDKIEELIIPLQCKEVYILADADAAGNKLRQRLKQELPNAHHLYTRMMYREVARTPLEHLAKMLLDAHFAVKADYLPG